MRSSSPPPPYEYAPLIGNIGMFTAKTRISNMAMKKAGMLELTTPTLHTILSALLSSFRAHHLPSNMASQNSRIYDIPPRANVFFHNAPITSETGRLYLYDIPQSPLSACPAHFTYCTGMDLSRPNFSRAIYF